MVWHPILTPKLCQTTFVCDTLILQVTQANFMLADVATKCHWQLSKMCVPACRLAWQLRAKN